MTWHFTEKYITLPLLVAVVVWLLIAASIDKRATCQPDKWQHQMENVE